MRTAGSVDIDRPIDDVFRLTNEHVAQWSTIVVEDEVLEQTPERVGTRFRTVTEENGQRMEFEGTVVGYNPPYDSAVFMRGKSFDMHVEYQFEDLGGSTRVTQRSEVNGKGMFKPMLALFGWLMKSSGCKALDKELQSLKAFCENQP